MADAKRRLPQGQYLTEDWPVLHYGSLPNLDLTAWTFRGFGLVETERQWTWPEFMALPRAESKCDIHCVTRWSRYDNRFEGIPFQVIHAAVRPKSEARYAMIHCEGGFTTNVPVADLLGAGVLFTFRHDGRDLSRAHGWPLRLLVPHLYFWKSAKWVRGIEFMAEDRPGFWENNGYHMRGDPWAPDEGERYSEA